MRQAVKTVGLDELEQVSASDDESAELGAERAKKVKDSGNSKDDFEA